MDSDSGIEKGLESRINVRTNHIRAGRLPVGHNTVSARFISGPATAFRGRHLGPLETLLNIHTHTHSLTHKRTEAYPRARYRAFGTLLSANSLQRDPVTRSGEDNTVIHNNNYC